MFLLQLARREMRSAWRRLVFFFICIAIGVGSIVTLRSIIRNFNAVFTSDARAILGADVQVESNRPWKNTTVRKVDQISSRVAEARAQSIEATTMVRPADVTKPGAMMVELKGIEAPYPFYGKIVLANRGFSHQLLKNDGAIVARTVLERLNLKIGDPIKIGELEFDIRAVVESEPGRAGGFRFGPRVIIDRAALEKAGVSGFGSRARRRIELKVAEHRVAPLVKKLRNELKTDFVRVRSYKQSQERLDDQFTRAENFLSLTGLVILVLGGIGVSSVTRVFIEQKKKSIAVLKCLGARGRTVIAGYLIQMLSLGLAGSIVGIVLAKIAMVALAAYYSDTLPPTMRYHLQTGAILQGICFGFLVTLLFAVVPLLRIRRIKPNVLFREEAEGKSGMDRIQWLAAVAVSAALVLLSSWQAGSLQIGLVFLGGLVVCALGLYLSALLLMKIVRTLRPAASFSLRHAITGLHRPGNQTKVAIVSIGLGTFFVIAIHSLQTNLLREMSFEQRSNLPNMYLIDIQKDQQREVEGLIRKFTSEPAQLIPTVRARIAAINGKVLDPESAEYKKDRGRLGFEYTLTYRAKLEETESILAGKFWDEKPSASPEVSIEESLKGIMGLDVGGSITFDILGRKMTAKVTSIRKVDWQNARTGFFVVFRPGALETAPVVYIAAVDGPTAEPQRSDFLRRLTDRFPNITAIDVADIVTNLRRILNNVTLAVAFIAAFVVLSGILILIGSIAMTKFQRIYEAALLKTLGAQRRLVVMILCIEHTLLGVVAGIVGSALGSVLAYFVCRYVFEIEWVFSIPLFIAGIFCTALLTTIVGSASTLDVLNKKPLAVLRSQ